MEAHSAPLAASSERLRIAWQRRHETDYIFDFWTALGWTILSCGFYFFYVFYQLMRRMRDHNRRRLELLDAANTFAWEQASSRGLGDELRPQFERVAMNLATLREMTTDFRDPAIWTVLTVFAGTIVHVIAYIFLDSDLVRHSTAEANVEADLTAIYDRLGVSLPGPDPSGVKAQQHNYVGRIIAAIFTVGIYLLWWTADVMREGNRNFQANWPGEDALAGGVQQLLTA